MYRLLSASKDTYIQNKYIAASRSLYSNVGQAGSLDLYKLFDETTLNTTASSGVELTRILMQFDYSSLQDLTSSVLDYSSGSFKAFIRLKDIYGGQTVPSNFTVSVFPLSKSFDEGRGSDVIAYRDLDAANWVTASLSPIVTWSQGGAASSGTLGQDVDIITSGNLGSGVVGLGNTQKFLRGDEDLFIEVTNVVSATLAGILPNNGFRISFIAPEEEDEYTRFVKRFGSRHTQNKSLHPKLIVKYDDSIFDTGPKAFYDTATNLFTYNVLRGSHRNYFSGSTEITGTNCLKLQLVTSRSVKFVTSSWSPSHSASINHVTSSILYYSRSFTGSQYALGSLFQTGIYATPVSLSLVTDPELVSFVSNSNSTYFQALWTSLDGTYQYASNQINFVRIQGNSSNAMSENLVVNITNLDDEYKINETKRLRVFAADYNKELPGFRVPIALESVILPDLRWRVVNAFTREVIIPWDPMTKMSTDYDGMYFDFFFGDLELNEVYEFELLGKNSAARDTVITNRGFRFKVINN